MSARGVSFDPNFKRYMQHVAAACLGIMEEFPIAPTHHHSYNPVLESASKHSCLSLGAGADETELLFRASDADEFVCDGNLLVDGGITTSRRLWLAFRYDSLTNYLGFSSYTQVEVLITSRTCRFTNTLFLGFDYQPNHLSKCMSRAVEEKNLTRDVLNPDHWQALHRLRTAIAG